MAQDLTLNILGLVLRRMGISGHQVHHIAVDLRNRTLRSPSKPSAEYLAVVPVMQHSIAAK